VGTDAAVGTAAGTTDEAPYVAPDGAPADDTTTTPPVSSARPEVTSTTRTPAARATPPPPRQRAGANRSGRPPQRRRKKRQSSAKKLVAAGITLLLVAGVITGIVLSAGGGKSSTSAAGKGPEGVPVPAAAPLAPVNTARYGQPIDGISCLGNEQVAYHIHAHLAIFVNGNQAGVPYGIGIAPPLQTTQTPTGTFVSSGGCFYWLHTHAADGVIHIESPTPKIYTLGQFFDIWGQTLSASQVGPATGKVTAFLNGKVFTGAVRDMPLNAHDVIQLNVGTPVMPPQSIDWSGTGL
jgi:hypothetical protein